MMYIHDVHVGKVEGIRFWLKTCFGSVMPIIGVPFPQNFLL